MGQVNYRCVDVNVQTEPNQFLKRVSQAELVLFADQPDPT